MSGLRLDITAQRVERSGLPCLTFQAAAVGEPDRPRRRASLCAHDS